MSNLFDSIQSAPASEQFEELLRRPGLRIERIVSNGQASSPGFWYDQDHGEWVLLVQGEAQLLLEGEPTPRLLRPGDFLDIGPHQRHRVEAASDSAVWLAVHYGSTDSA